MADGHVLKEAARDGDLRTVRSMLQRGADVNSTTEDGWNALLEAAGSGHLHVVRELLQCGAHVHSVDNKGQNALHKAAWNGHMEVVKELLQHGADVHSADKVGCNALHKGVYNGHMEVVKQLLQRGADLHSADHNGQNALHDAAWNGNRHMLEELLQRGADVHRAGNNGQIALHSAAWNGHMDVALALLHSGADLHRQDIGGDTALHLAALRGHTQMAAMLWRAGADPFKRNRQFRTARAALKRKDRELYKQMGAGRVRKPTLPPLPPAAIAALTPLTPLQDALQSVLQAFSVASDHCATLITKQNCSRSLPEWKAAHDLLVLAVTDDQIHPEHPDDKLFFWKDQMYCTVSDIPITNDQDKLVVFDCLRQAQQLNLIDSADAYIQGIHLSQSVNSELFVLKKACVTLFGRVMSLETTIDNLRASFDAYRQQQLYCNVIAIALKLIPIAGGAVSNALEVAAELSGEMFDANIIEYSLSAASAILEQHNFCKIPPSERTQIVDVFAEYGFTTEQVRRLFDNRESVAAASITNPQPPLEATTSTDQRGGSHSAFAPAFDEDASAYCPHQSASDEDDSSQRDPNESESDWCEHEFGEDTHIEIGSVSKDKRDTHDEQQSQRHPDPYNSKLATLEFAKDWTHFVLNVPHDNEQLFDGWNECLTHFLRGESVSPRTLRSGTPSNISRFTNGAKRFVQREMHQNEMKIGYRLRMVQFVYQYVAQHTDQPIVPSGNSQTEIMEMANDWTQFVLAPGAEQTQLHSRLNACLVRFLEDCSVSPQSLRFALPSDISELQNAVEKFIENKLGEEMKLGYYFKLTQFLNQFTKDG